jgi:hypothetical protein
MDWVANALISLMALGARFLNKLANFIRATQINFPTKNPASTTTPMEVSAQVANSDE